MAVRERVTKVRLPAYTTCKTISCLQERGIGNIRAILDARRGIIRRVAVRVAVASLATDTGLFAALVARVAAIWRYPAQRRHVYLPSAPSRRR